MRMSCRTTPNIPLPVFVPNKIPSQGFYLPYNFRKEEDGLARAAITAWGQSEVPQIFIMMVLYQSAAIYEVS